MEKDCLHLALQTKHDLFSFFLPVTYSGLLHNIISGFARLLIPLDSQHSQVKHQGLSCPIEVANLKIQLKSFLSTVYSH